MKRVQRQSFGANKRSRTTYTITTKTSGSYLLASTSFFEKVYIQLFGNGESTEWKKLDKWTRIDFKNGSVDEFHVDFSNVGLPELIKLKLKESNSKFPWACEWVKIKVGNSFDEEYFPLYDWVDEEETSIVTGKAIPGGHPSSSEIVNKEREKEIETSRDRYPWIGDAITNLPKFVDEESYGQLPVLFKMDKFRRKSFLMNGFKAELNAVANKLSSYVHGLNNLNDYMNLFKHLHRESDLPSFIHRWQSDEEFGRQQLIGVSPLAFKKCTSLPEGCLITNEDIKDLTESSDLATDMKSGRLFIADYSKAFLGVDRNIYNDRQLYCPDPICLYYVNSSKNLTPIAIQLKPEDAESIFTPNDPEYDWLLAKMYFKVAMTNAHEWLWHFLHTHGVMETVAVSLFRNLPRAHPLYKLLRPHLQTVSAINAEARTSLILPGSEANKALSIGGLSMSQKAFREFSWSDLNIPDVITRNGLDCKYLTKYYYKDDALALWKTQKTFVTKIIKIYYATNQDVVNDTELQAWLDDLANEGFGWEDKDTHGVPESINTIEQLIEFVVTVMFTSSVQHAAVNFPQYEYYKYIPNSPPSMRLDIHKKGEGSLQRCMDSLPDEYQSSVIIAVAFTLSSIAEKEAFLGDYPMELFTDLDAKNAEVEYKAELEKNQEQFASRNDNVAFPYVTLYPSAVPNSIAI